MDSESRHRLFARVEEATDVPMLLLAIAFLVAVTVPEILELSPEWSLAFEAIDWTIWAAFAFELIVKLYLAPDRRHYLRTHWIDVITVMVPVLRPLRLLRVLVVGIRFWSEARAVLRERTISVIGTASLLSVGAAAVLVYVAERGGNGTIQTFGDALWWAAATITTVGYGDVYPKTAAGRGVAVVLMLIGISLFGLLTARVASFFVQADEHQNARYDEILRRLTAMELAYHPQSMAIEPDGGPAPTHLRNAFLDLLEEEREGPTACALAAQLMDSTEVLPFEHCDMLDLPAGSTFGQAAAKLRTALGCLP